MIPESESKEWTNEQNIEAAKKFKEEGNKSFVAKEYKKALKAYHKAFLHLGGIIDKGSAMSAYSNKVASKLTQIFNFSEYGANLHLLAEIRSWTRNVSFNRFRLTKASKIKTNAKLFYRRGICFMRLSEFQKAREDLLKVVYLDQVMKAEIQKLMQQLKSLQKRQNEKSKDMFKKFFK